MSGARHPAIDRQLQLDAARARSALLRRMRRDTPELASGLGKWLRHNLAGGGPEFFLHPDAFPVFHLARWFARARGAELSPALARATAYSNVAASYWIRLVDDVMDEGLPEARRLLPILAPLQLELLRPYEQLFARDPEALRCIHELWRRHANDTFADAALSSMDRRAFEDVVCNKFSGARLPLWVVARSTDQLDALATWYSFLRAFGTWHQMLNDMLDWRRDLEHGVPTFFLSLSPGGTTAATAAWVLRVGLGRAAALLQGYWLCLERAATALGSSDVSAFLARRNGRWRATLAATVAQASAFEQFKAGKTRART
jgi:hypothetical protein